MRINNKLKFHRGMLVLIIAVLAINICILNIQLTQANQQKQIVFIIKPEDEMAKRKLELDKANKEIKEIQKLNKISLNWSKK